MKIYMWITKDRFELPIAVADSVPELAKIAGKTVPQVETAISHWAHGKIAHPSFIRVEVEDE
jgi:hypothetical protein